jgi:hypothetical protein
MKYKFDPTPNGQIDHVYCIHVEGPDEERIVGITIEDTELAESMMADIENTFNTLYYNHTTEQVTPRPIITASINQTDLISNGVDIAIISNLPIPCTITIDPEIYEVTDGVFEFTVDTPGTYTIKAECFPYQPKEWEVIAE